MVIWRPIPYRIHPTQTLKYEVSNHGSVRRRYKRTGDTKLLKPWLSGGGSMRGYQCVWLYGMERKRGNKFGRQKYFIHRLVALVFGRKPSEAHTYVHHKDGSKANNHIKNLQFSTPEQNANWRRRGAKRNLRQLNKKRQ